ncbi:unnamed protein product [Sphagnum tenellum]
MTEGKVLNELFFLNARTLLSSTPNQSGSTRYINAVRKSLVCERCGRIFHKPFGLQRHRLKHCQKQGHPVAAPVYQSISGGTVGNATRRLDARAEARQNPVVRTGRLVGESSSSSSSLHEVITIEDDDDVYIYDIQEVGVWDDNDVEKEVGNRDDSDVEEVDSRDDDSEDADEDPVYDHLMQVQSCKASLKTCRVNLVDCMKHDLLGDIEKHIARHIGPDVISSSAASQDTGRPDSPVEEVLILDGDDGDQEGGAKAKENWVKRRRRRLWCLGRGRLSYNGE